MEHMDLILTPAIVRRCLGPLSMFGRMPWLTLFGLIGSPNSLNKGFNLLPAAHPPPSHTPFLSHLPITHFIPLPPPPPSTPFYIHATHDITVVVKKVTQNIAVLAS